MKYWSVECFDASDMRLWFFCCRMSVDNTVQSGRTGVNWLNYRDRTTLQDCPDSSLCGGLRGWFRGGHCAARKRRPRHIPASAGIIRCCRSDPGEKSAEKLGSCLYHMKIIYSTLVLYLLTYLTVSANLQSTTDLPPVHSLANNCLANN